VPSPTNPKATKIKENRIPFTQILRRLLLKFYLQTKKTQRFPDSPWVLAEHAFSHSFSAISLYTARSLIARSPYQIDSHILIARSSYQSDLPKATIIFTGTIAIAASF
jgi:hypothetical protein